MLVGGEQRAGTARDWAGWFGVGLGQWVEGFFLSSIPCVSLEGSRPWEVHSLAESSPTPGPSC